MALLRTPEERFAGLPGYPFEPRYVSFGGVRMHYVDEGPEEADVILCLHGNPTWSYLYRKMIPPLARRYRVVAPDFLGCGRSDKYPAKTDYSFELHYHALARFTDTLDLERVTLVCQDWGGLLGLTLAADVSGLFERLVIMNTGLPSGDEPVAEAFLQWRAFNEAHPDLQVSKIVQKGLAHPERISAAELAAYDAPFPDVRYKAGIAAWPSLVPLHRDDAGAEDLRRAKEAMRHWDRSALVMFSDRDPITADWQGFFLKNTPGAHSHPIRDAGHFLQEEKSDELADAILDFMAAGDGSN